MRTERHGRAPSPGSLRDVVAEDRARRRRLRVRKQPPRTVRWCRSSDRSVAKLQDELRGHGPRLPVGGEDVERDLARAARSPTSMRGPAVGVGQQGLVGAGRAARRLRVKPGNASGKSAARVVAARGTPPPTSGRRRRRPAGVRPCAGRPGSRPWTRWIPTFVGAGFEASVACASDRLSRSGAADGSAEDWHAEVAGRAARARVPRGGGPRWARPGEGRGMRSSRQVSSGRRG